MAVTIGADDGCTCPRPDTCIYCSRMYPCDCQGCPARTRPTCDRCKQPSTYDCTLGRCAEPIEGPPTVPVAVPVTTTRKKIRFWLQPTPSFPDGAPQRENYTSDGAFERAVAKYDAEWCVMYECIGCADPEDSHHIDCPGGAVK